MRGHSTPFRPRWTGLKGFGSCGTVSCAPDGRQPARALRRSDRLGRRQRAARPGARGRGSTRSTAACRRDRAARLRKGGALRRCPVLRPAGEADPGGVCARAKPGLGAAVARPAHARPRRSGRRARRARAARPAGIARRRRCVAGGTRPAANDSRDVQGHRRPVSRVDALALSDARLGADGVPGHRRRRGARAALARHRSHLPSRRAGPGGRVAGADRADLAKRAEARRARAGRSPLRRPRNRPDGRDCCRALASRRRAGRLRHALVYATCRTSRPKRSTRRRIRSAPRAS